MRTVNKFANDRLRDITETLRRHAHPDKWKSQPGYTETARKDIINCKKGLEGIGIKSIEISKAIDAMFYGEYKTAYEYLYETSNPQHKMKDQFDARLGKSNGDGALKELIKILSK